MVPGESGEAVMIFVSVTSILCSRLCCLWTVCSCFPLCSARENYIILPVSQGVLKEMHGRTENTTVEPLNKGHSLSFVPCREVVPISEVK